MEGITHSMCSIEFENHRPLYDWVIDNIGFEINDENYDYVIYPDYLKDNIQNEGVILVEIPSHNFVSKNPFERIQARYAILEKLI